MRCKLKMLCDNLNDPRMHLERLNAIVLYSGTVHSMVWSVGAECWSGVGSIFGVEKWATLPSIQIKLDHIL